MEIQIWPIDKLVFYARNPRRNDAAVERMCGSIREFGFKIPCLARSDGEVIDGHLRLKAARRLGITDIPVIPCDEWTPAQVKAFRLMVNRSAAWADWDEELLTLELADLRASDFDLVLTGFDMKDLDDLLVGAAPDEDAAPPLPGHPVTPRGRSVALWSAPGAVRRRDRRGGGVASAGRTQTVPDGDRSSLRY
jgi:ParB-like chromosome segregation protein Spo0J